MLIPRAAWRVGTARTGTAPHRRPLPAATASLRPVRPAHLVRRTAVAAGRRP